MRDPDPTPRATAQHPPRADQDMPPAASLTVVPIRSSRARLVQQPSVATPADQIRGPAMPRGATPSDADPAVLTAWWDGLKRGRDFPALEDIDTAAIAATWPDVVLLGYDSRQAEITRATRLGGAKAGADDAIEYSPMVTEWLLALGRKAARRGAVMHETREFPVSRGMAAYRIVALPLRAGQQGVDHVLCHLGSA